MNLEKRLVGVRNAEEYGDVVTILELVRGMKYGSKEDVITAIDSFARYLEEFESIEEMSISMKEKCLKVRQLMQKEEIKTVSAMMQKAKEFIEENYWNSKLSVADLCICLNVSATHFSTMFKKEFGMSFVSYLTKVRLEHAVELLDNTDEKSYLIAEMVGYTEPNYFSYVFKKQYGVSPSQYRAKEKKSF